MRNPLGLMRDLLAFKEDALAFFRDHDDWDRGVLTLDFGVRTVHVIERADLATQVLTSDAFERGHAPYGPLGTMAGQGSLRWLLGPTLPTLDGEQGTERRARVRPIYVAIARRLKTTPLPMIDWSELRHGRIDLFELISRAVFSMVCRACFGADYPEWSARVCEAIERATAALDQTSKSFQPYACHTGRHARTIRRSREVLEQFAQVVYAELTTSSAADSPMRQLSSEGWSDADAIDEIITTLVAGVETTSITCCWAAIELTRSPRWASSVRAAPDADRPRQIARILDETTRLYPAFWTMIRVVNRTHRLEHITFGDGDVVFVSPLLIHNNPAYWPDPTRFDPARHIDRRRVEHGDFMPFGFGPRACIGAHLSRQIAARIIDALCHAPAMAFPPTEPDGPEPDPRIIVLASRTGFHLDITDV